MPDIAKIRKQEMSDIEDFCEHIREYGHIFYFKNEDLEEPFNKILEGIKEIKTMMDTSWSM